MKACTRFDGVENRHESFQPASFTQDAAMPSKPLSKREVECLHWAAMGKTSWEIGIILGVSERTVNFHVGNACGKLGVYNRRAAVAQALKHGLLPSFIS